MADEVCGCLPFEIVGRIGYVGNSEQDKLEMQLYNEEYNKRKAIHNADMALCPHPVPPGVHRGYTQWPPKPQ